MTPLRPLPAGQWIALDERDHRPSCVLSLSQAPSSEARWRLRLYAPLGRAPGGVGGVGWRGPPRAGGGAAGGGGGAAPRPPPRRRGRGAPRGGGGRGGASPPMMGVSLA